MVEQQNEEIRSTAEYVKLLKETATESLYPEGGSLFVRKFQDSKKNQKHRKNIQCLCKVPPCEESKIKLAPGICNFMIWSKNFPSKD